MNRINLSPDQAKILRDLAAKYEQSKGNYLAGLALLGVQGRVKAAIWDGEEPHLMIEPLESTVGD